MPSRVPQIVLLVLSIILLQLHLGAAVINVPEDHPTIQEAVDAASDGDEIVVDPGIHPGFNYSGKNLNIHSTDPTSPTVQKETIIKFRIIENSFDPGSMVVFTGSENESARLAGFTITGGVSQARITPNGSGIEGNGCTATIEYNIIFNNIAYNPSSSNSTPWGGGGITDCDGLIQHNVIDANFANKGAGLYRCNGIIQNNLITRNRTRSKFSSNTPIPNTSVGSALDDCNGIIRYNTIVDNFTSAKAEGGGLTNCNGTITNNIIWHTSNEIFFQVMEMDNVSTPSYSTIKGWDMGGLKNIAADPLFMDVVYKGLIDINKLANQDYRLHADSPAIDAGASTEGLTMDFDGNPRGANWVEEDRGDGSNWDMGALEFTTTSLNLWIPNRPLEIQDGSQFEVKWLAYGEAGDTIQLSLHQDATFIANLGQFTTPIVGQIHASTIQLPRNLPQQSGYTIIGASIQAPPLAAESHPFTIIPGDNAVGDHWQRFAAR